MPARRSISSGGDLVHGLADKMACTRPCEAVLLDRLQHLVGQFARRHGNDARVLDTRLALPLDWPSFFSCIRRAFVLGTSPAAPASAASASRPLRFAACEARADGLTLFHQHDPTAAAVSPATLTLPHPPRSHSIFLSNSCSTRPLSCQTSKPLGGNLFTGPCVVVF